MTLLLIDGNAIIHRAFYAIPQTFRTSSGTPTNAVYGFLTMLNKAMVDFHPDNVIICYDTPKPTFRKKLFKKYQAHRPKLSDELVVQIPYIKEMVDKAGIIQIEKEGYEADDLIGTLVKKYKHDYKILILTGDKDIMQLIDENVFVISPQTGLSTIKLYDREEVKNKLGVTPEEIPDLKGLMGDPSDNYTGAKGIGPKTALSLLSQFKSVETIIKNIGSIENERVRKVVEEYREDILLAKQLATIHCDVPINFTIESSVFTGFKEDLKEFLTSLQMSSLVERIFSPKNKEAKKTKPAKEKQSTNTGQADLFT